MLVVNVGVNKHQIENTITVEFLMKIWHVYGLNCVLYSTTNSLNLNVQYELVTLVHYNTSLNSSFKSQPIAFAI